MPQLSLELSSRFILRLLALTGFLIFIDALAQWRGRPLGKMFAAGLGAIMVVTLIAHAIYLFGLIGTLIFLLVGFGIPYLAEGVGLRFGMAGSRYEYSGWVGPLLPMGVPLYVMIAWVCLLYGSFAVPCFVLLNSATPFWLSSSLIMLAALVMVGVDLIVDPIAICEGRWTWDKQGTWFGIPLGNFLGWFLTAAFTMAAIAVLMKLLATQLGPEAILETSTNPYIVLSPIGALALLHFHLIGRTRALGIGRLGYLAVLQGIILIAIYFYSASNFCIPVVANTGLQILP